MEKFKNRSESDQKPTRNQEFSYCEELYAQGTGFSFGRIPTPVLMLPETHKASPCVFAVAIAMAKHTADKKHFPRFSIGRSRLAKMAGISEKQVSRSINWLTENSVVFVRSRMGLDNVYTWNEELLKGMDTQSRGVVTVGLDHSRPVVSRGIDCESRIYIEFILDLFYKSSFKEFFQDQSKHYKFYISKKWKNGDINDSPQGSGETVTVSRKEAWSDAAYFVYERIIKKGNVTNDALVRVYLGLVGAYNIEEVYWPKGALYQRVMNYQSINESRAMSHLKQFLHTDEDLKDFIEIKLGLKNPEGE